MPKEIEELWNKGKSILKDLGADIIDISPSYKICTANILYSCTS